MSGRAACLPPPRVSESHLTVSVVIIVSASLALERAVKEGALELKDEIFIWEFDSAGKTTYHRREAYWGGQC